jgi:oxygen-independent coproporphyrinogen-3 oxidase
VTADALPGLGLYIHIPFCEVKCSYCHFAIDPGVPSGARQERYANAVLLEMERRAATAPTAGAADTLYFGGGTPSLLGASHLAAMVQRARDLFALGPDAEVTIEANPKDLDDAGYAALRAAGATRLSLGVQHFDPEVLRAMGRAHAAADNAASVAAARRAGFDNVSVDLILGWPGETEARWQRTLASALALAPEHVSLYILEVDGRNVLAHQERAGTLLLPEDDLVADLYLATVARLAAASIARYEISNFARPGCQSRHNARYWADLEFLGFGLSAHSYTALRRSWNEPTYGRYLAAIDSGTTGEAGAREPSARERLGEALFTGLRRTEGIDLADFGERYGVDVLAEYRGPFADAFAAGLLEQVDGRLRLTDKGVLLSNEVFQQLV